jgi:hypothetical protein
MEYPRKMSKIEIKHSMIGMGIQNLPEFYYEHYYKYPETIKDMRDFITNHNDYMIEWEFALNYLKKRQKKISILSERGLFVISENNHFSYNNSDICEIIALQKTQFYKFIHRINLYNNNNRNVQEIIGYEKCDSINDIFRQKRKIFHTNLDTANFMIEQTPYCEFDKRRWTVLEYSLENGLKPFCNEDNLELSGNGYFSQLENICKQFCEEQNIVRMIFCNMVIRKK